MASNELFSNPFRFIEDAGGSSAPALIIPKFIIQTNQGIKSSYRSRQALTWGWWIQRYEPATGPNINCAPGQL